MAEVSVFDTIIFSESLEPSTKIGTLEDVILLSDEFDSHRYFETLNDWFAFQDSLVVVGGREITGLLTDSLVLDEFCSLIPPQHIEDFLFVYDWLELPSGLISDTVTLSETISGWSGPAILDVVEFVEILTYANEAVLDTEDELTFVDDFHGVINDPWQPVVEIPEARS